MSRATLETVEHCRIVLNVLGLVRLAGIEPATFRFPTGHSAAELQPVEIGPLCRQRSWSGHRGSNPIPALPKRRPSPEHTQNVHYNGHTIGSCPLQWSLEPPAGIEPTSTAYKAAHRQQCFGGEVWCLITPRIGAAGEIRTLYLSLTRRAHIHMCFDSMASPVGVEPTRVGLGGQRPSIGEDYISETMRSMSPRLMPMSASSRFDMRLSWRRVSWRANQRENMANTP